MRCCHKQDLQLKFVGLNLLSRGRPTRRLGNMSRQICEPCNGPHEHTLDDNAEICWELSLDICIYHLGHLSLPPSLALDRHTRERILLIDGPSGRRLGVGEIPVQVPFLAPNSFERSRLRKSDLILSERAFVSKLYTYSFERALLGSDHF